MARWIEDLFFGGERGGGKSDFQLGYQEDGALLYGRAWRGIVFRKTYPELEELQARAMEIFPGTGAIWKPQPSAQHPFSNCWYWPSGASVKMRCYNCSITELELEMPEGNLRGRLIAWAGHGHLHGEALHLVPGIPPLDSLP